MCNELLIEHIVRNYKVAHFERKKYKCILEGESLQRFEMQWNLGVLVHDT